jgi:MFS family permease
MSRPEDTHGARLIGPPFVFTVCSTFAGTLSLGILLPVLPRYAEGPLSAGAVAVGLSVGASSITAVLAQPLVGRLGDVRGRRVLLVGGPLVLAAVGAAYLAADSIALLIVLRLVACVGEGMVLVGGASVVTDIAPPEHRGQAISYYTLAP